MSTGTSSSTREVVVILNAGTDAGRRLASHLLCDGYRVAISGRHATQLTKIMHGYPSSQVFAVAADPDDPVQLARLHARVSEHFGTDQLHTVAPMSA